MKFKFLVLFDYFSDEAKEILKDQIVDIKSKGRFYTEDELAEIINGYDALFCDEDQVSEKVIKNTNKLKVISKLGVGYDSIDVEAATRRGIAVTYAPEAPSGTVADFTFGLILACVRRISQADKFVKAGGWDFNKFLSVDVFGKTLGVIGAGRIGSKLIKRATGFDMNVLYYQRHRNPSLEREFDAKYAALDDLLKKSDIVCLTVPLTNKTRGLVGERELCMMKKDAFLINTARGAVVDEKALYNALKEKRIAGAGIDVFTLEPPNKDNPLLKLGNVVVTPHIASATRETLVRLNTTIAEDALRFLNGEKPKYILNPEVIEI